MYKRIVTSIIIFFFAFKVNAQAELELGEFYWDSDPGFGNGLVLANLITKNLTSLDSTLLINVNSLTPGNHILYVRFKDKDGNWSQPASYFVMIAPEQKNLGEDPADVRKLEYAWDEGTVSELNINGIQDFEFEKSIPTSGLGIGFHQLSVRFKDPYGYWSIWHKKGVFIENESPGSNITRIEYFLNTDPGLDMATSATFTPAVGNDVESNFEPSTSGLQQGLNLLTFRAKDASGNWSAFYTKPFINDNSFTLSAGNVNPIAFCETVEIPVPFTTTGVFPNENTFKLQLSDINGQNFVDLSTIRIGNTLKANIPTGLAGGFGYRIRVLSSLPLMRSISATVITVKTKPYVSLYGTQTINFEQSSDLTVTASGTLPITYTLNEESFMANSSTSTRTVAPTITTYYTLTSTQNECGAGTVNSAPVVVTVICPANIVHSTGTLPATIYQASSTIISQKKAINSPLSYRAGGSISLEPGFEVSGNVFRAQIGGCL